MLKVNYVQVSDGTLDGLLYSQDDVDASSNLVLLHWHEREGPPMEYSDDSATSLAHQRYGNF